MTYKVGTHSDRDTHKTAYSGDILTGRTDTCVYCGQKIYEVQDPISFVLDWGSDTGTDLPLNRRLDYGCDENPESGSEGVGSHLPSQKDRFTHKLAKQYVEAELASYTVSKTATTWREFAEEKSRGGNKPFYVSSGVAQSGGYPSHGYYQIVWATSPEDASQEFDWGWDGQYYAIGEDDFVNDFETGDEQTRPRPGEEVFLAARPATEDEVRDYLTGRGFTEASKTADIATRKEAKQYVEAELASYSRVKTKKDLKDAVKRINAGEPGVDVDVTAYFGLGPGMSGIMGIKDLLGPDLADVTLMIYKGGSFFATVSNSGGKLVAK